LEYGELMAKMALVKGQQLWHGDIPWSQMAFGKKRFQDTHQCDANSCYNFTDENPTTLSPRYCVQFALMFLGQTQVVPKLIIYLLGKCLNWESPFNNHSTFVF